MNKVENFYKSVTADVFPGGDRDIELQVNKLLWIINHKTDRETAKKILLKSVMISILSEDFTQKRLIEHLKTYAIQYFTESELDEFYKYLLDLKDNTISTDIDSTYVRPRSEVNLEGIKVVDFLRNNMRWLFWPILITIVVLVGSLDDGGQNKKPKEVVEALDPYWSQQQVLQRPSTMEFWKEYYKPIKAPFKVVTTGDDDYVIKLTSHINGKDYIQVFIRGGEEIDILVPLGKYELKYAVGNMWYGINAKDNKYFGVETSFHKADEIFEFYETDDGYMGNTVELYLQRNGNLRTSSIDSSSF